MGTTGVGYKLNTNGSYNYSTKNGEAGMIESLIRFDDRQKEQRTVANVRSKEVKLESKIK